MWWTAGCRGGGSPVAKQKRFSLSGKVGKQLENPDFWYRLDLRVKAKSDFFCSQKEVFGLELDGCDCSWPVVEISSQEGQTSCQTTVRQDQRGKKERKTQAIKILIQTKLRLEFESCVMSPLVSISSLFIKQLGAHVKYTFSYSVSWMKELSEYWKPTKLCEVQTELSPSSGRYWWYIMNEEDDRKPACVSARVHMLDVLEGVCAGQNK